MEDNIENKSKFSSYIPHFTPLHKKAMISGLGVLVMTLGLATGVVLIQSDQDIRSSACTPCPGGSCPDGWTYGPDECSGQSCDARAIEACRDHQGGGGGGGGGGNSQYCAICTPNGDCECIDGQYNGMKCKNAPNNCSNLGNTWQPDGSCPSSGSCGTQGPPPPPGNPNICEPAGGISSPGCANVPVNGNCAIPGGGWCDKTGVNDEGFATCACRPLGGGNTACSAPNTCKSSAIDCVSGGGNVISDQTCSGSQVCCYQGSGSGGQCGYPACESGVASPENCFVATRSGDGNFNCNTNCAGKPIKCTSPRDQQYNGDDYLFTCCEAPSQPPQQPPTVTGSCNNNGPASCSCSCPSGYRSASYQPSSGVDGDCTKTWIILPGDIDAFVCEASGTSCSCVLDDGSGGGNGGGAPPPPPAPTPERVGECKDTFFETSCVCSCPSGKIPAPGAAGTCTAVNFPDPVPDVCKVFFGEGNSCECIDAPSVSQNQSTTINNTPITIVATKIINNMGQPVTENNKDANLNGDSVVDGVDWALLADQARSL